MLDISLRQLETFVAAAEYGSFTRAAERLHLTQSTVSMHIQALEQALGAQLILRGARKRFALTDEGKRVYTAAKDILSRCEALQELRESVGGDALRIGTSTVPAQSLMPRLMAGFLQQHPGVSFLLRRGDSEEVRVLLEQGEVRIGSSARLCPRGASPATRSRRTGSCSLRQTTRAFRNSATRGRLVLRCLRSR